MSRSKKKTYHRPRIPAPKYADELYFVTQRMGGMRLFSSLELSNLLYRGWVYEKKWPQRIEDRSHAYLDCERCGKPMFQFWTDTRIWEGMHWSWWNANLCPRCVAHLYERPNEAR